MHDEMEPIRPRPRDWLAAILTFASVAITVAIVYAPTEPWPRRMPGGGESANTWGPGVALVAALVVGGTVAAVLRRRRT